MVAPTIPVSADSVQGSFRDTIDIGVDVIHPVPVASVVFPAVTVRMLLLCPTIKTMEAIEMVTVYHRTCSIINVSWFVQIPPSRPRDFKKAQELVTVSSRHRS
ncbi:hypothetical protein Tco_0768192 [Tanacetum coccineum]